jgi:hypothetical protein
LRPKLGGGYYSSTRDSNLEKPFARFAAIIENTVDPPQEKYGVPQLMRMLKLSRVQTPKIPLEFGGGLCASFDA